MPIIISILLTLLVLANSSSTPPPRYNDLDPAGADPWVFMPVHHHRTGARPQWNDGDALPDEEAKVVLCGLEGSLRLWELETDFPYASETIATWDHGRFALEMLTAALGRQGDRTAYNAALVIRRIGPYAESAVPAIVAIIEQNRNLPKPRNGAGVPWDRRAYAALALGGIGPKAERGVPTIGSSD